MIGGIAGYFGGWLDNLLMRVTDLFLGLPQLVALIILTRLPARNAGPSRSWARPAASVSIITVMALLFWMSIARVVRGLVLSLKEKEFVEAAKAMGASDFRILTRHLLPNCVGPLIVSVTIAVRRHPHRVGTVVPRLRRRVGHHADVGQPAVGHQGPAAGPRPRRVVPRPGHRASPCCA